MGGLLELLIAYGAGTVTVFALWRTELHDRARESREHAARLRRQEQKMIFALKVLGDVTNHLQLSPRYGDELLKVLTLSEEAGNE